MPLSLNFIESQVAVDIIPSGYVLTKTWDSNLRSWLGRHQEQVYFSSDLFESRNLQMGNHDYTIVRPYEELYLRHYLPLRRQETFYPMKMGESPEYQPRQSGAGQGSRFWLPFLPTIHYSTWLAGTIPEHCKLYNHTKQRRECRKSRIVRK